MPLAGADVTYLPYVPNVPCTTCGATVTASVRDGVCHYAGCRHAQFASFDGKLKVGFQ